MGADREQLLRVPGIGPVGADAIIRSRRRGKLTELVHLKQIGIRAPDRLAKYVLLNGRQPAHQLRLL